MTHIRIPTVYMRGGTSKGVFFRADVLPDDLIARDRVLLRVIGSPDPYGKHIDGMGGATSSTSKVAIISKSTRSDCDVDYLFGAVSIESPIIDWSGNCGNLASAVGPFSINEGLVSGVRDGIAVVRIWQANIGKRIIAHVPMERGEVVEKGVFELDGVAFPAAEIKLEFLDPGGTEDKDGIGSMFPTGNVMDVVELPGVGKVDLTLINAGNPTIFVNARALGLIGNELPETVNANVDLLEICEAIRTHAAVMMGLGATPAEVRHNRPATPKLAFVAEPTDYTASSGKIVNCQYINLNARILSMGKLHHAMTGTGAVAIAVAAAIPNTIVHRIVGPRCSDQIRFGHPSGTLAVGAETSNQCGEWIVTKVVMSRTARRLMEGWVFV